jgi:hypothetical protein
VQGHSPHTPFVVLHQPEKGCKGNKQWVWLAIDVETREIIGCPVGIVLPNRYKRCGILCCVVTASMPASIQTIGTLMLVSLPSKRHFAVDKDSG